MAGKDQIAYRRFAHIPAEGDRTLSLDTLSATTQLASPQESILRMLFRGLA